MIYILDDRAGYTGNGKVWRKRMLPAVWLFMVRRREKDYAQVWEPWKLPAENLTWNSSGRLLWLTSTQLNSDQMIIIEQLAPAEEGQVPVATSTQPVRTRAPAATQPARTRAPAATQPVRTRAPAATPVATQAARRRAPVADRVPCRLISKLITRTGFNRHLPFCPNKPAN